MSSSPGKKVSKSTGKQTTPRIALTPAMFDICDANAKGKKPSTFLAFDDKGTPTGSQTVPKAGKYIDCKSILQNESVVAFKNSRNTFTNAEKAYKTAQANYQRAQDRLSRTNVSLQSK